MLVYVVNGVITILMHKLYYDASNCTCNGVYRAFAYIYVPWFIILNTNLSWDTLPDNNSNNTYFFMAAMFDLIA